METILFYFGFFVGAAIFLAIVSLLVSIILKDYYKALFVSFKLLLLKETVTTKSTFAIAVIEFLLSVTAYIIVLVICRWKDTKAVQK